MSTQQYDTLTDQQVLALASTLLERYDNSYQGDISLLCRSENATLKITTTNNRYALRIHRPDYHSFNAINSELLWLDALRENGIEVPIAIANKEGERVQTLTLDSGEQRYAVMFGWIEGDMPTTEVDPKAFFGLGAITAKLHQHAKSWQRPASFERIIWNHQTMVTDDAHWGRWQDAPHLNPSDHALIHQALTKVAQQMAAYGMSDDRYGLIHADLRLTNILLFNGQTRVIDFDDCGMGWYMHDLAAAISFNEHLANAPLWVDQWLNGYETQAHCSDSDLAILPAMIIQRRIQMLAWTGTHAQTEMTLSLGDQWANESVRLCRRYLETDGLPIGQ
ncbi:phosphotransferase enzyme family protein [Celerinatantimonas sp. MCCC 1A17872]|uniref:phosphotransferase enzyme family protein n=1 Tax=Celerinatantimonas sp. MCCC 1A17872 TaxID=3177514 RepID=UPI0038BEA01E